MKIKFSWGHGLLITIIAFVTFLVSFALYSLKHDINLVSKDYFPEEIAYQQKLKKIQNTDALKEKLKIEQTEKNITITLPEAFANKTVKGDIKFFFVKSYRHDVNLKLIVANNKQIIDITKFTKGRYFLKIDWEVEKKEYYQEIEIIL